MANRIIKQFIATYSFRNQPSSSLTTTKHVFIDTDNFEQAWLAFVEKRGCAIELVSVTYLGVISND